MARTDRTPLARWVPDASEALARLLDAARGPVEAPIRSQIFGPERFAQHGRSLGDTHEARHQGGLAARLSTAFFPRLRQNIRVLREAHDFIATQASTGYDVSPAAVWLLDNFHLVEAQLEEIQSGLPRRYFRNLPVLIGEPLAGLPRVYGIAWAFVAHTDGAFDEALLARFLAAYQETRELTLGELWALPTTLRVVLVENLRRLAERIATNKAARELANRCSDRIDSLTPAALDELLLLLNQRGIGRVFLAQFAQRLQDPSAARPPEQAAEQARWLAWLGQVLPDLAAVQTQQPADQAADNLSVGNAISSLRLIGDADWPDIVGGASAITQRMLGSPTFAAERDDTRDQTLHEIERLAQRSRRSEPAVADELLALMNADHSGARSVASHWLRGPGRGALLRVLGLHDGPRALWSAWRRRFAFPAYLLALLVGTAWLVDALLQRFGHSAATPGWLLMLTVLLMLFPASEAMVAVVNRLISESVRPRRLPRLALAGGIPAEHRVLVVVPALLTSDGAARALAHRLQLHHLANPQQHAQFALLTDFADAATQHLDGDAALLAAAVRHVDALNAKQPAPAAGAAPRFIVLHRERLFSQTEQRWIGWERKRGKLEQLIAVLAGDADATPFIDLGDASRIAPGAKYIVTLDSDTELPPGRLRDLVGIAAHPHNQPVLSDDQRRVVSGYGILQPRVVTPLPAPGDATPYHWLFAGQCGIDPYSAATSEVYQDLFRAGTFTGKGLLNVAAMHAVLASRLPEGQVLSHDLLEGAMARCAAVTDITVIEDAPFHADVAAARVHRWTRGDWQLLPLLLRAGRLGIGAIDRWKMVDNLRRSLVAPASLALLLLALASDALSPWAALGLVFAALAAGPLMGAVAGFAPSRDDIARRHFYREAVVDALRALTGASWLMAQLLQQALLQGDAVARALWRSFVSRRRLLQWTTAAAAQASAPVGLRAIVRRHRAEPLLALALLAALLGFGISHPLLATALGLAWAASPLWTWWASTPRVAQHDACAALPEADRTRLTAIARDTWRLFERCVGPDDHHLPPDNLQSTPHDMVAHRTSPTNIGLYLLGTACARRFGWIGTQDLLARLEATLATLTTLDRQHGHFLNWYDTETAKPLQPLYVSTVDSGNLSGHLLAVAQACLELADAPYDDAALVHALAVSRQRAEAARAAVGPGGFDNADWCSADHIATLRSAERDRLAALADPTATDAARRLRAVAALCQQFAWAPDYAFLYHRKRRLFHIGFRVAEQQLDASFYDLLASESRLTSLLAIAKADVPVGHWAALGRPLYSGGSVIGSAVGMRSWSGSMFEYLMPTLVIDEPRGSVLHAACRAAVAEQIAFARSHGVPWGISESAYAASDYTLAYQYAPQGVPRLALRRTPADELVIAPYATTLATMVAPREAIQNLQRLEALQARGRYGFIEALDYTPSRQAAAGVPTPVDTWMAHHQGMTIVALANVLLGGLPRRWGMADTRIEAVASLLHERVPREVSTLRAPPASPTEPLAAQRPPGLVRHIVPGLAAVEPTQLLSNGRYAVSLRPNGAGASRCGAHGISRWRDDALRDAHGTFFYMRWDRQPEAVSLTQHPAPDANAEYRATVHGDRVCFDAVWPTLRSHITVWVSPEDDIEFRQVELHNLGDRVLDVELMSAFEPTLADDRADEAHPAFGNLFLTAHWQPEHRALHFERKPRLATESGLHAAHFLAEVQQDGGLSATAVRVQTQRRRWLGRNGSAARPLAAFDAAPTPGVQDTGLDPVAALSVRLRIAPLGKARLTFCTAAAADTQTLHAVIDKYHQPSHVERASLMSATLSGIRLRDLRIGADTFAAVQTLSTALLLNLTRGGGAGAAAGTVAPLDAPHVDRRLLWRFGISGDRPIVLVAAGSAQGTALLRSLAQALHLWSWGGLACDLVVINAEPTSYLMTLQPELATLRERFAAASAAQPGGAQGGFFVLRSDELGAADLATLRALARVRLQADGRSLVHHVREWIERHEQALERRLELSCTALPMLASGGLEADAGIATDGDFDAATGEYRFDVSTRQRPPRPWINVLANPGFGAQVSEAGGGYSWGGNSRLNQLTAWSNDAVADPPGEWFLLQDMKTMQVWHVAPSAGGDPQARHRVAHGQGYTQIQHKREFAAGPVEVTAGWCVDPDSAVKQVRIRLVNRGHRTLRLRAIGVAEWVMGANRGDRGTVDTQPHFQRLPQRADGDTAAGPRRVTALLCTQRDHAGGFGNGTAFLAITGPADAADAADGGHDWTCDRREWFDARGRFVVPDHFGQKSGSGLDPCAALASTITLGAGESTERVFLLGYADSPDAARALAALAGAEDAANRMQRTRNHWDALLGAATVKTPDPLFDALVNRWLLYQTVACRLWAKAGFYQAGGAFGFRDQLQDAMALAWAEPALLRAQIVLGASRQFAEGDVQHWWHAPTGAGVRTHFSDDLLWLPHATVHYLTATGDDALLDEPVPFLDGAPIPAGAEDAYYVPTRSAQQASVYEHGARAIDRSLRSGAHGLPLMGSGDWNDGMNRVGHGGRGESVWLAWFLCKLVADFAPIARQRGDDARAGAWEAAAHGWQTALHAEAWDGQWFRRAFFDDGSALGSAANAECRIDLIAQAWSVLSGAAQPAYQRMAMAAVQSHLIDAGAGLLRLLDPPLAAQQPEAGYIQAYPPGVRENGAQYSHAAVWALMAQAQRGDAQAAWFAFTCLSPAHRSRHPTQRAAYELEPYVMAGDIYSQPPYVGRGGWSWYTGSAAWLQRAAIESMFGLQLRHDTLRLTPCLPPDWNEAELSLRRDGRVMRFLLLREAPPRLPAGATLLRVGETLHWRELPAQALLVVPCGADGIAALSYSGERRPPMAAESPTS